jgi:hypothetical protein
MKRAAALFFVLALPAMADTQFRVRQMTRGDVPLGKGQCDIRLQVDGEAEVSVRSQTVSVRTISGRDPRDDGSECNEPLPERNLQGFNFEVMDRRGDIALLSQPSPRNGFTAVVRIRDSQGGEGRYHFRLSWQMTGGGNEGRGGDYGREGGREERGRDYDRQGGNFGFDQAIRVCQDAVTDRIWNQYRYRDVGFENVRADDRPGRNDYVIGDAIARHGRDRDRFLFDCSVDFRSGRVRSVEVRRR